MLTLLCPSIFDTSSRGTPFCSRSTANVSLSLMALHVPGANLRTRKYFCERNACAVPGLFLGSFLCVLPQKIGRMVARG